MSGNTLVCDAELEYMNKPIKKKTKYNKYRGKSYLMGKNIIECSCGRKLQEASLKTHLRSDIHNKLIIFNYHWIAK